jgi:hypothetical protein
MQCGDPSFRLAAIPPENSETYRWRGDLGILDRLSYGDSGEIPRNWGMTSLNADRIKLRNESLLLAIPTNLSAGQLMEGNENIQTMSQGIDVPVYPPFLEYSNNTLPQPAKKKR